MRLCYSQEGGHSESIGITWLKINLIPVQPDEQRLGSTLHSAVFLDTTVIFLFAPPPQTVTTTNERQAG